MNVDPGTTTITPPNPFCFHLLCVFFPPHSFPFFSLSLRLPDPLLISSIEFSLSIKIQLNSGKFIFCFGLRELFPL